MALIFSAVLAYLMEITDIFSDPPFSAVALLLWILPIAVGLGIGASALALKWRHYAYDRTSAHFILTIYGLVVSVVALLPILVVELGILQFAYEPWIYPLSLMGISSVMVSMAMTWHGRGLRKVSSIGASVIPLFLLAIIMAFATLPVSYLLLVMGYLGSAICYQLSGSMLHILATSTSAQERQIIRASGEKSVAVQKELNSRQALLDRREKAIFSREAHLESYDKELSRAFMFIESRRKELAEFQAQVDKREHELLGLERRVGKSKADVDAKMSELEIVRAELKAEQDKAKRMRQDLERTAATLQRKESKIRRREIQLDAKTRELASLEKAMSKEKGRHDQMMEEIGRKSEEMLARERELGTLERGSVPEGEAVQTDWERLKEKEEELAAQSLKLESMSTDLGDRESSLLEALQDLRSREALYVDKEVKLSDREAKLEQEKEALEMERKALVEETEALKGKEESLRDLSAEARKKVTDYDSRKEELGTKGMELELKEKALKEMEESIQTESKSIDERLQSVIEREKSLDEKEAIMNLRTLEAQVPSDDHEEREKAFRLREHKLREKEKELKARAYQLEKDLEMREQALQQKLRAEIEEGEELVIEERKVEKVKTGISKLDDLLYGGFPFNSNVLFIGPAFLGKEVAILNFIAEGLRKGIPAVVVTTSKPPQEITKDMNPVLVEFVEYEQMGLVKWIDATSQVGPEGVGFDEQKRVYRVDGASDLKGILAGLHEIEEILGNDHAYFRVAYLSLSPSVSRSEPKEAYDFIQRMVNALRKTRFVGAFALEKGMHDPKEIETIEHQMDGAILFKQEDQKTYLSVQGVCDAQTRDWVQYRQTDRGLIIGAFSLERIK